MKRYTMLWVLVCLCLPGLQAQDEPLAASSPTKPAKPVTIYTPQAGDIGLSVDLLAPIMTYVGNMFNDNTNNVFPTTFSGPNYSGNVSVSVRYFLWDDMALRAALSVNNVSATTKAYVTDDAARAANPLSIDLVTDSRTVINNDAYLALGIELRRGYKRLQGFYGGQLIGGFQSQTTKYAYGNAITSLNQAPSQAFPSTPLNNVGGNSRLLTTNTALGRDFLIGVGGFVGLEYFILPKLAVGGEVNLSLMAIFGGQEYEKSERYNASSAKVEENTRLASPGSTTWVLNTHQVGNGIYLALYF